MKKRKSLLLHLIRWATIAALAVSTNSTGWAQVDKEKPAAAAVLIQESFAKQVQPLLKKYCLRCHNADKMESGIRLDRLNGALKDRHPFLWKEILTQVEGESMPPEDELQPTAAERTLLAAWIPRAIAMARARDTQKNGSIRRLTVSQYKNTLRDLLSLEEDLTNVLPPDGVSKDGFTNNGQTLLLSPLQVESYFDIAEKSLDLCLVDEASKPAIQSFRMDLGTAINPHPFPDKLILGANSLLLNNQNFMVTELTPVKPFDYLPFRMRKAYEFIEGYEGNSTVRGLRKYDSIYHSVFACMRGTGGYPQGQPFQTVANGLLLRPAIPSSELFGQSSTYGPMANFKLSLRELPDHGNFRVTVTAAKYDEGVLLERGAATQGESVAGAITVTEPAETQTITVETAGLYQADVYLKPSPEDENAAPATRKPQDVSLKLGDQLSSGKLFQPAFLVVRLSAGPLTVTVQTTGDLALNRLVLTPLNETDDAARRFETLARRSPRLGVHVGLRRDCGSTLNPVGPAQTVSSLEFSEFVFEGAINNFPSPDVEKDNVNYLAGIREIGVRSEYTDGRDMPRLLIRSVAFEGPFYKSWPPATHRAIFIESDMKDDPPAYAREIIQAFATRAFRRPITTDEQASIIAVWESSFADTKDFSQSIKDALLVVLTAPQFLFLIENNSTPEPELLDGYELASKLSYFLWNAAPDAQLLKHAAEDTLHQSLDSEIDRMIHDRQCEQFVHEFTSQWLSLDKFDVVEVDQKRYPKLTRDTKTQLRNEPIHFLQHLIRHNMPLRNILQSDFILANEVVADYYGLAEETQSGFQFVPIKHQDVNLGGLLTQASILAGLSDGRESNPVKRGAWLARKIIAEPPDDPPPNVPQLTEDDGSHLTLRQKLERHRNQKGCIKCHAGIDPWGIPFEEYDAGGRFKKGPAVDASSTLPDETEIADLNGLKSYLANDRIDRVAFSFLKHLASYAVGRSLTYNEVVFLQEKGLELKSDDYCMQDMIRFVIKSELFLTK
jgi:hypothetical protein